MKVLPLKIFQNTDDKYLFLNYLKNGACVFGHNVCVCIYKYVCIYSQISQQHLTDQNITVYTTNLVQKERLNLKIVKVWCIVCLLGQVKTLII